MPSNVKRPSRKGLAPAAMLAIAGVGLVGFLLYKHMKAKGGMVPRAPEVTSVANAPAAPQSSYANDPAAPQSGPAAPESQVASSRAVSTVDPELVRLNDATFRAQDRLTIALAGGDTNQIENARETLQSAQQALLAKKRSMY